MKFKKTYFEDIILCFLILYTSLYKLLPFSNFPYLDEGLLVFLLLLVFFNKRSISINKPIELFFYFIGYAFIITVSNLDSIVGFASEFLYLIKAPLVFIACSQMNINIDRRNFYYIFFIISNIPSIFIGIWQYMHRTLGWALGLKMRNGIARITGYAGHPIWFAFTLITIIIITWFLLDYSKKHKVKSMIIGGIITAVSIILIFGTRSRYPLAVLAVIVAIFIYLKFPIKNKGFKVIFAIICILVTLYFTWSIFQDMINISDESAARSIGFRNLPRAILNYPFGSGIGTFGNKSSIIYNNNKVYQTIGLTPPVLIDSFNLGNYYESTFVQRMVETGIPGVVIYFYFFLFPVKYYKTNKDYLDLLILVLFALNAIMNVIYQLPLIYISAIAYTSLIRQKSMQ